MTPVERLALSFVRNYPERVSRLVEEGDTEQLAAWLDTLDEEPASGLLTQTVPLVAACALGNLEPQRAARLLSRLEPGIVAGLLRRLEPSSAKAVQEALPVRFREQVARLLQHSLDQAGGRLDPRAPAVSVETTAGQALERVREAADGSLNYVYVIDSGHKLVGVCSMRELMASDPKVPVRQLMSEAPYAISADAPLEAVLRHVGWRKAHAMPVTDADGRYLGVLRYSTFRAIEAELGESLDGADAAQTSAALAELFWIGTSAMARLGGAALLGRPSSRQEPKP